MVSLYLFTNGISGMYVGWIPDFYGRRTTILYSLGASLLIQLVYIFDQSHLMRYICFFLFALCNVKNGCSYVWAFEMAGAQNKVFVTTVMNAFDRCTLAVMAFFLLVFTRWWLVIAMFYWILGVVAWLLLYSKVPESPQWHMMNSRNTEAINCLNQIAAMNEVQERIDKNT
jgi:MFS family permease